MAKRRHLERAPITEALIDLRVVPKEGLSFEALREAFDGLEGYYAKGPITQGVFQFSLPVGDQQPQTSSEATQVGMRLHSKDEKFVAQCSLGGFTLSRLSPYESWENLRHETSRVWRTYVDRLEPIRVTRIATRFINNLRLPMQSGASFQRYVNKLIDVPDEAPQAVEAFFQQFRLVDAATDARVVLTLTHGGSASDGVVPLILDIETSIARELTPTDQEIWRVLGTLRELKNRIFFGTITERTAELYE
jgi:uncharacterized protein (TIGR04255 family)